jgi:hypothetical protein
MEKWLNKSSTQALRDQTRCGNVTAGSLTYWEPSMDGVVTHVGKGDGAAEGFREAQPRVSG